MRSRSTSTFSALDAANWLVGCLCVALALCLLVTRVLAANPASGSISAGTTAPVTWVGTATGTGSAQGESTCVDGVNCDVYTLTVSGAPSDYAGHIVDVKIHWTVPADDYDLYIHQGDLTGPVVGTSAGGAPGTTEEAVIDPASTGVGTYTIHVVYFTTISPADQYQGAATIQAQSTAFRHVNYAKSNAQFSPNVTVKAPVTTSDGEPSSRTDFLGNFYVCGIRGVPAGVDLWYDDLNPSSPTYDPLLRHYHYQGQPDTPQSGIGANLGADGGGDVDLAVGFPASPTDMSLPALAYSSLVAANISVGNTTNPNKVTGNNGKRSDFTAMPTYHLNPAGNLSGGAPVDDREWQEFYGSNAEYILYRTITVPPVGFIQRSDADPTTGAAGFAYMPAITLGQTDQTGCISVDQHDGTVYASFNDGSVFVGMTPTDPTTNLPLIDPITGTRAQPVTYTKHQVASDPNGVAHIFFPVKVADDGTVYVAYSNDHDIFTQFSTDHGTTWSLPAKVNSRQSKTNVFPWLATGPTPGSVGIVWYGTTDQVNDDAAEWRVYYAQTYNATAAIPTFYQTLASDHYNHAGNISEGGTTGTANRNLLDYFQVSFAPDGSATIGYTDDHNDTAGNVFVTHQIGGQSINNTTLTPPAMMPPTPPSVPAAPGYPARVSTDGSQVIDYANDVSQALLVSVNGTGPNPNPTPITGAKTPMSALDILGIKYTTGEVNNTGIETIIAKMTVSSLATLPASATYRMEFVANAPHHNPPTAAAPDSGISPTGDYSFALSDHGDQFYVQATTDSAGATTAFTFGTVTRGSDGSLTYTSQGTARSGSIDMVHNTITITVGSDQLNPFVTHGAPVGEGTIFAGLRGQAFGPGSSLVSSDETRGGTQFKVQ